MHICRHFCNLVCSSVLFNIVIISLGEERAGLYASRAFVCLSCMRYVLSFFSSPRCQGLGAARDWGTHWTVHVTVFFFFFFFIIHKVCNSNCHCSFSSLWCHWNTLIWATTWQNQQNDCAPSLIRVFVVRMKKAWALSYLLSAQRRLIRLGGCTVSLLFFFMSRLIYVCGSSCAAPLLFDMIVISISDITFLEA